MSYVDEVIDLVVKKNPAEPGIPSGSKRGTGVSSCCDWKQMKKNSVKKLFLRDW